MKGKTALITGGSSAIGRATACHFAREGVVVIVAGRNSARGGAAVRQVQEEGGEAVFIAADFTQAGDVAKLVESIVDRYGSLDFAVNNVGGTLGVSGPVADCPEDQWDSVLEANLKTMWFSMKFELTQMRKQESGAIVNTIGALGLRAVPNLSAYVASKHAAVGLTKSSALENVKYGIRVNGIAPGMSRRFESAEEEQGRERAAAQRVPMGRLAEADEIAAAAVWLCSDQSSFVNGHVLAVDGGWLARI